MFTLSPRQMDQALRNLSGLRCHHYLNVYLIPPPQPDGPGSDGPIQCTLPPLSECLSYPPTRWTRLWRTCSVYAVPTILMFTLSPPPPHHQMDQALTDLFSARCPHYLNVYLISPHQMDQALMNLFSVRCPHYLNVYLISPTRWTSL